jgi:hypothetical protein
MAVLKVRLLAPLPERLAPLQAGQYPQSEKRHANSSTFLSFPNTCIVCAYGYALSNYTRRDPTTTSTKGDQTDIQQPIFSTTGTER